MATQTELPSRPAPPPSTTTTTTDSPDPKSEPKLDGPRHIRFWLRNLRSILSHHYTSNDSTRLTLGFFILSALDLLAPSSPPSTSTTDIPTPSEEEIKPLITPQERKQLRAWILNLQHPHGGFCGSPHHVLPKGYCTKYDFAAGQHVASDPENANIAATCFALLTLGILADGDGSSAFDGVYRFKTLRWLKTLQREDGSFGELIDSDGHIIGGRDMRYCYIATIIRWALGGGASEDVKPFDIDVDALVRHIRNSQTYDGGMGESSTLESHSGYTYCSVAALSLLDMANSDPAKPSDHYLRAGIPSTPSLVRFLVGRQIPYTDPTEDGNEEEEEDEETSNHPLPNLATDPSAWVVPDVIGFNGRWNKHPDTCYVWWGSGALAVLGEDKLINHGPVRRFILDKTQHLVGGFAKYPGGPPDMYHAYMGLAALGALAADDGAEPGMRKFDVRFCASADTVAKMARARHLLLNPEPDSDSDDD